MLHDLCAPVVEDEQVVVGLEKIDGLTGEEPGDVESGLAHLDDAVDGPEPPPGGVTSAICST